MQDQNITAQAIYNQIIEQLSYITSSSDVEEFKKDYPNISNKSSLEEAIGADSVDMLDLVNRLESTYSQGRKERIKIKPAELSEIATLSDITVGGMVEVLAQKLNVAMTPAEREKFGNPDRPLSATIAGEIKTAKLEIEELPKH